MKATRKPPAAHAAPGKAPSPRPATVAGLPKNPAREWIAHGPAFAKAKPGESDLPDYKKKALPAGTRLTAILTEDTAAYWRIKDGRIAGKPLPRNIRVIEKSEWTLLPVPDDAGVAAAGRAETGAEAGEVPAAETAPEAAPAPPAAEPAATLTICIRGMRPVAPHLKPGFKLVEEGWFTHKKWAILPVARAVALHEHAASSAGRALLEKMPGMPPGRFVSDINRRASDVYILSFAWEAASLFYRSKSTGMILPLNYEFVGNVGFDKVDYSKIAGRAAAAGLTEADWTFLQEEFEFVGGLNEALLGADVETIFKTLCDKIVIVVMLNDKVGQAWLLKLHERINTVLRPLAVTYGVETIDINDFVQTEDDLAQPKDNGGTFKPRIFAQLAERVKGIIGTRRAAGALAAAP